MTRFFITGTDTGAGKTWFTCWLVRNWRRQGFAAAGLKPLATGDQEDALALREAMEGTLSLAEINPVFFTEPAAPLVSARVEGRTIDWNEVRARIESMAVRHTHLAVEGVGGWRVPLAEGYEVRDWARDLGYPVVVVALNRLGVINHTLLTVESIQAAGLTCAGVVLNEGPEPASPNFHFARSQNIGLLRETLLLPVFEFGRRAEAAGEVPLWLGGK